MSKFTIDGEEFNHEGGDINCPQCQRPVWMVELGTHLFPTRLAEQVQAGVRFMRECMRCKTLFSTN